MKGKTPRKRRAVSPVIASLLLVAIAVATSILMYSWVQSMVGSSSKQAQTYIRMDEVIFSSNTTIQVSIRNTGSIGAVIQTAYIYDGDTRIKKEDEINCVLQPGNLDTIDLTITDFVLDNAHVYLIKLVTDNGFTVEANYYSPGEW